MWIIQSIHEGPVVLNDVGIMLTHGQTRDLDLIGREKAERSNDVRIALGQRPPLIKTIKKDPHAPTTLDDSMAVKIAEAGQQVAAAAQQMQTVADGQAGVVASLQAQLAQQIERNKALEELILKQGAQTQQVLNNTSLVLEQVRAFAEKHPVEIRSLRETLENIKVEKKDVEKKLEELPKQGFNEEELKTQERILKLKQEKLQKNAESIGKSISESASDVDSELDILDQLGI